MKSWMLGKCQNNSFQCISKASKNSDLKVFENCQSYPMYFTNISTTLRPLPGRIWQKQWWEWKDRYCPRRRSKKGKVQSRWLSGTQFIFGKARREVLPQSAFMCERSGLRTRPARTQNSPSSLRRLDSTQGEPTTYGSCPCCVVLHSTLGITWVVIVITRQVSENANKERCSSCHLYRSSVFWRREDSLVDNMNEPLGWRPLTSSE